MLRAGKRPRRTARRTSARRHGATRCKPRRVRLDHARVASTPGVEAASRPRHGSVSTTVSSAIHCERYRHRRLPWQPAHVGSLPPGSMGSCWARSGSAPAEAPSRSFQRDLALKPRRPQRNIRGALRPSGARCTGAALTPVRRRPWGFNSSWGATRPLQLGFPRFLDGPPRSVADWNDLRVSCGVRNVPQALENLHVMPIVTEPAGCHMPEETQPQTVHQAFSTSNTHWQLLMGWQAPIARRCCDTRRCGCTPRQNGDDQPCHCRSAAGAGFPRRFGAPPLAGRTCSRPAWVTSALVSASGRAEPFIRWATAAPSAAARIGQQARQYRRSSRLI